MRFVWRRLRMKYIRIASMISAPTAPPTPAAIAVTLPSLAAAPDPIEGLVGAAVLLPDGVAPGGRIRDMVVSSLGRVVGLGELVSVTPGMAGGVTAEGVGGGALVDDGVFCSVSEILVDVLLVVVVVFSVVSLLGGLLVSVSALVLVAISSTVVVVILVRVDCWVVVVESSSS